MADKPDQPETDPRETTPQPEDAQPEDAQAAETVEAAEAESLQATSAEAEAEPDEDEEYEEEELGLGRRFLLTMAMPSWLVSVIVHMVAIIILTLIPVMAHERESRVLTVSPIADEEQLEELEELPEEPLDLEEVSESEVTPVPEVAATEVPTEVTEVSVSEDVDAAAIQVDLVDFSETTAPKNNLLREIGALSGNGLEGRGAAARGKMVSRYGGTKGSEEAVALALKWIAAHQLPDGGWTFQHTAHPQCAGKCDHPGTLAQARNGATAMALLPFLGAGNTHKEGDYKKNVQAGLYFLMTRQKPNGSFHEGGGSMYSHGLCAIALCEAYAMTHDKALMLPAQRAINFIVMAQDPVGGGWRYNPKQPGDTSVVGWQLMALKSAHMGYLQVPPMTVAGASKFLDAVQADSGSKYGYAGPGAGSATTAVGLLCRMYLGWKNDNPALERGVNWLAGKGPSNNMYYSYYATQVMKQFEGPQWEEWNTKMRDSLVASQDKEGHQKGSWFIGGDHGAERGGRLYTTSMATMILEVYYRHMPIYSKAASEEEFPL